MDAQEKAGWQAWGMVVVLAIACAVIVLWVMGRIR